LIIRDFTFINALIFIKRHFNVLIQMMKEPEYTFKWVIFL
jgi:hypothetical protein